MPEKMLKKLNTCILPQWKVCFLSAICVGIIAHFYKITNHLPNWDSLVFRYDSQNMIALGRWFLPAVCAPTSFYDLPFLNGIIAILFHALSAVAICRVVNVKNNITAFMIGAITISFPTVTSVMMYSYVADGYSIAFFLSTLCAMYMTKEKPNYIVAAILLALSVGIYQAYITVAIMLVLLNLIDETIYKKGSGTENILKRAWKILLCGIAGMLLYYAILKILLAICGVTILDYQGMQSAFSLSEIDVLGSLYTIKETFLDCFFDLSHGVSVRFVMNVVVMLFTLAHYVRYVVKNKVYKTPMKLFLLIVMGVMLILGAGALSFLNATVDYHNLMLMGYSVFYIFFIIIYERGNDDKKPYAKFKTWMILLTALTLTFNQIVIANVSYHKAQMAYEKSYGVLMRIDDRIEQTHGADKCDTILVLGALKNSQSYSVNLSSDITGITDGYILRADDETVGQSVLCSALNDYCGKNYSFISGEEKKAFAKMDEVIKMPSWPKEGCVKVIDGVIVIKLDTESE